LEKQGKLEKVIPIQLKALVLFGFKHTLLTNNLDAFALDCERRVEIDERVSFGCGDGDCLWSAQSENYISTTNENQ
jgi:hypothetical protein